MACCRTSRREIGLWVGFRVAGATGAAGIRDGDGANIGPNGQPDDAICALANGLRLQGAMAAAKPAVVGLLAWVVFKLGTNNVVDWSGAAIAIAAFTALFFKGPPGARDGVGLGHWGLIDASSPIKIKVKKNLKPEVHRPMIYLN